MRAYNSIFGTIKSAMAAEEVKYYKVTECRNNTLYGGVECYTQYAVGAYTNRNGQTFSTEYDNIVGTISSEGNFDEVEIPCISVDFMLRKIKSALKEEAFKAPEFVGNIQDCPEDDDGMWWNNHRMVPSSTVVEVNNRRWIIYYQD